MERFRRRHGAALAPCGGTARRSFRVHVLLSHASKVWSGWCGRKVRISRMCKSRIKETRHRESKAPPSHTPRESGTPAGVRSGANYGVGCRGDMLWQGAPSQKEREGQEGGST